MTRHAYARLLQAKLDPIPLLKKAGLTRGTIANPAIRIPVNDQITFLNIAAEALEDDLLGFHLAQLTDLREAGLLYYVLASSKNLLDALRRAARYSTIVNEGIGQRIVDGRSVGLTMRYQGVSRHRDRHQAEIWIVVMLRVCRQLTGMKLVPSRVRLIHRRRSGHDKLAEFLGIEPEFSATTDEVTFDSKVKSLPLVGADPYLNKLLTSYADDTLKRMSREHGTFRSSVENTIVPLLPHGGARAETIAAQLGISQRTFTRRLAAEATSFSKVTERLRADLARSYLADQQLTVSEIAWLLGYRDVTAFSHAFKRWTGKNPRQVRAKH